MSDFGEGRYVVARKEHRCEGCFAVIAKGESHYQYKGMYDGDWQNWRLHQECHESMDADSSGEYEFTPGSFEVPERIRWTEFSRCVTAAQLLGCV